MLQLGRDCNYHIYTDHKVETKGVYCATINHTAHSLTSRNTSSRAPSSSSSNSGATTQFSHSAPLLLTESFNPATPTPATPASAEAVTGGGSSGA